MIARPDSEINADRQRVEDKIRRSPPKGISLKKMNYLIRINARIFEVGMIFSISHLGDACLFYGLVEQDSLKIHLGYEFKLEVVDRESSASEGEFEAEAEESKTRRLISVGL